MTSALHQAGRQYLQRLTRSVPLKTLQQGSTLSVRSKIPNVAVRIQSGWRDDGHATLEQHFRTALSNCNTSNNGASVANLVICQEEDQVTSLGRSESHLSILLEPTTLLLQKQPDEDRNGATTTSKAEYQDGDALVTSFFTDSSDDEAATNDDNSDCEVTIQVPEKVNLICELDQGGSIHVDSKIEGDVKLMTSSGDIRVKKLRGHTIDLETKSGDAVIYASDLLEAQYLTLNLQGGRFRAKRIHGATVDIKMTPPPPSHAASQQYMTVEAALGDDDEGSLVDISSMYVSGTGGAHVSLGGELHPAKRGVRIKSHHGPVLVNVTGVSKPTETTAMSAAAGEDQSTTTSDDSSRRAYPLVDLGSVNGSCEVSICNVQTHQDGGDNGSDDWTACQVHYDSISSESVSLISSDCGDIGLTFDRKLEADLRLLSTTDRILLEKTAAALAEEEDSEQVKAALVSKSESGDALTAERDSPSSRIFIKTESFTEIGSFLSSDNSTTHYTEGWVENKSHEPDSRFEMKTRGAKAAGKINFDGAADQALKNFSRPATDAGDSPHDSTRPLIVAATTGRIAVETLSWLGAIARRYGLDEKGRNLGRQASRRGRVIVPADE